MKIKIERFKKIQSAEIELGPINVFIGTNNAGKSSFIQGVQFAISTCQTLELKKTSWKKAGPGSRASSLDSTDFLYAPTRNIENLYNGTKLTGSKHRENKKHIVFHFNEGENHTFIYISKGKNGGFSTYMEGRELGNRLSSVSTPYCVYIPGIAGIPIEEKFEVPITIKKSAVRGDSNNYLRNILWEICQDTSKWRRFSDSISAIYQDVRVNVHFNGEQSEFIYVNVKQSGIELPIDSVGTGLLQTIQIFAYIEYFSPKIILLDEPDSHLHPSKQKKLAEELLKRTVDNDDLKVVFSTHSRYILDALDGKSNVVHFQDGQLFKGVEGSKILMDIGAADADYLFSKRSLKYIIVTEDKVDDIEEKKQLLKKFVLANGVKEDEFVLHSYESCTKVDSAKILREFVRKHIPTVQVIIHYDRDQRDDEDSVLVKLRIDCQNKNIPLFITEFSEIENYFCQPKHISQIFTSLAHQECEDIYNTSWSELVDETKHKIKNYFQRENPRMNYNKDGNFDSRILDKNADEHFEKLKDRIIPGKEILGKIKNTLQSKYKIKDPNTILSISQGLVSNEFQSLISKTDQNNTLEQNPNFSHNNDISLKKEDKSLHFGEL